MKTYRSFLLFIAGLCLCLVAPGCNNAPAAVPGPVDTNSRRQRLPLDDAPPSQSSPTGRSRANVPADAR